MIKKNLNPIAIVVLTICLVGVALDRIIPADTVVHAASETYPALSTNSPSDDKAVPLTRSAQPVVLVVIGFVTVLFGTIAISPLLIGDPAELLQDTHRADDGA